MTKKELKRLALKIAKAEQQRLTASTKEEVRSAEAEIIKLTGLVDSIEDMVFIDEYIQENCDLTN